MINFRHHYDSSIKGNSCLNVAATINFMVQLLKLKKLITTRRSAKENHAVKKTQIDTYGNCERLLKYIISFYHTSSIPPRPNEIFFYVTKMWSKIILTMNSFFLFNENDMIQYSHLITYNIQIFDINVTYVYFSSLLCNKIVKSNYVSIIAQLFTSLTVKCHVKTCDVYFHNK